MLIVAEPYRLLFEKLGLQSVEALSRFFLPAEPSKKTRVIVQPARLPEPANGGLDVFYKQYHYSRPAWSFLGRRSKARCEYDNYAVFASLNLPAAEALAVGEDRDPLGRLRRAVIVTRAIPGARTLLEFMQDAACRIPGPATRAMRARLVKQLAAMTRRIHDAGFFHHDLVWRNVLVTAAGTEPPRLWWIDCPRGGFARWPGSRRRRQIKDLASLDKPAGRWCTRGERVLFIREYLGLKRLNRAAKALIRDALRYRKTRWPEDWNED